MRKGILYFALAVMVFAVAACGSDGAAVAEDLTPENTGQTEQGGEQKDKAVFSPVRLTAKDQAICNGTADFAWGVFGKEMEKAAGNCIFSPLSAQMLLAMVQNGAGGETAAEINRLLGFEGYAAQDINDFYRNVVLAIYNEDSSVKFQSSNALWINQRFTLNAAFTEGLKENYSADIFSADFTNQSTAQEINQWCKNNTNGLIEKILDSVDDNDLSYLLNAIYYKAAWKEKFDKKLTKSGTFNNADGQKATADFMQKSALLQFYSDADLQATYLPMGAFSAFDVFLILPNEGKSLGDIASGLAEKWKSGLKNGKEQCNVNLYLPKFSQKQEQNSLRNSLALCGMKLAFSEKSADFSPMIKSEQRFYLKDVFQSCYFSVNEDEAEAAAVTGGVYGVSGLEEKPRTVDLRLDRPFIYGLREKNTGCILMLGAVQKL